MVGKRIEIDDETWQAINFLRQERRRSFQQLATEALHDLLVKYHRPVHLKDQLKQTLAETKAQTAPRRAARRKSGSNEES